MLSIPFHKHTIQHTPYFIYFSFGIFDVKARAERRRRVKKRGGTEMGIRSPKNIDPTPDLKILYHGM